MIISGQMATGSQVPPGGRAHLPWGRCRSDGAEFTCADPVWWGHHTGFGAFTVGTGMGLITNLITGDPDRWPSALRPTATYSPAIGVGLLAAVGGKAAWDVRRNGVVRPEWTGSNPYPGLTAYTELVEEALSAATGGDLDPFERLLEAVAAPYDERTGLERYADAARPTSAPTGPSAEPEHQRSPPIQPGRIPLRFGIGGIDGEEAPSHLPVNLVVQRHKE